VFSNYLKTNKLKKIEIKKQNIKTPIIETNNLLNNNSNMSAKFTFSIAEKRTVIVLMLINSFALFVNYFGLSYRIDKTADLFTNSTGINGNYYHYPYDVGYSSNSNHFYPLVDFTSNNYPEGFFFKGIFAYYDTTEFIVYTLLIFGFVLIKKIW
jgi:hypothetical protein